MSSTTSVKTLPFSGKDEGMYPEWKVKAKIFGKTQGWADAILLDRNVPTLTSESNDEDKKIVKEGFR